MRGQSEFRNSIFFTISFAAAVALLILLVVVASRPMAPRSLTRMATYTARMLALARTTPASSGKSRPKAVVRSQLTVAAPRSSHNVGFHRGNKLPEEKRNHNETS